MVTFFTPNLTKKTYIYETVITGSLRYSLIYNYLVTRQYNPFPFLLVNGMIIVYLYCSG